MNSTATPLSARATNDATKKARTELAAFDDTLENLLDKREIFLAEIALIDTEYKETLALRQQNPLAARHPRQDFLAEVPAAPVSVVVTNAQLVDEPPSTPVVVEVASAAPTETIPAPAVTVEVKPATPSRGQLVYKHTRSHKFAIGFALGGFLLAFGLMLFLSIVVTNAVEAWGWTIDSMVALFFVVVWILALFGGTLIGYSMGTKKDNETPQKDTAVPHAA